MISEQAKKNAAGGNPTALAQMTKHLHRSSECIVSHLRHWRTNQWQ